VNLTTVRDWLGHKDITTTSRYLKSTTTALDAAARSLEQKQDRRGAAHEVSAEFAHQSHKPADWPIRHDHTPHAEVSNVPSAKQIDANPRATAAPMMVTRRRIAEQSVFD
jgi:hypothetical protein